MYRNAENHQRITSELKPVPPSRDEIVYTEIQFNRKLRNEWKQDLAVAESDLDPCTRGIDYLMGKEIADLIEIAGLTPEEKRICWQVGIGADYSELAKELGVTPYRVQIKMTRIRRRMRAAAAEYRFVGLWQVYRQETCLR